MNDSIADALRRAVGMQPATKMGGMVGSVATELQAQPYRMHIKESQALGQTPMSAQDFMRMMQQK